MKLLVTGSKGQLGTELVRQAGAHELVAVDRDALDITDAAAVSSLVTKIAPDVVINAAAYTAVDRAEKDVVAAFAVNRDGPAHLAQACAEIDIPLVHVSTDYVFDGSKQGAYREDDPIAPLGVYGESKAAGEALVREYCRRHIILRTSWVFSSHGNNFVKTMLRLGTEREELEVVADQYGCPTSASDIASAIILICEHHDEQWGTYHFCQPDSTSWHGFAEAVFAEFARQGIQFKTKRITAISTQDYPTLAKRPVNSRLNCGKLEASFGIRIRPWHESLVDVIGDMRDLK